MDLLTWFSSVVDVMGPTGRRQRVVPIPRISNENSHPKIMKKNIRDPTVGCIVMDLLTRFSSAVGEMAPIGRRQRFVPIPRNSIENSRRKLVKKIWARSNGRIYSYGPFDPVLLRCRWNGPDRTPSPCRTDSTQLHRKQRAETREKNLSAIQRSDL